MTDVNCHQSLMEAAALVSGIITAKNHGKTTGVSP
jgi:hypothetical protein